MKQRFFNYSVRFLSMYWALLLLGGLSIQAQVKPPIISQGQDGRITYLRDALGNRVPDFSHCGYAGSDRPIPMAMTRIVVSPESGDSTLRIQSAIDFVSSLTPDTNGLRGAVLLLKGRHEVFGQLRIEQSGVVIRGQGMNDNGTRLIAAGTDRRTLIRIMGQNDCRIRGSATMRIMDDYVPVGASAFRLEDPQDLKVGDFVRITRPSPKEWIDFLRATDFGGGVGGGWKPDSRNLSWDRRILSIKGKIIMVDAPITTALEKRFGGGLIAPCQWPGRISNVGLENLQLESAFDATNPKDENHSWCAITLENTVDAWIRQITFKHFAGSAVALYETCQRVTVQDCLSLSPISEIGGYRRHTFITHGQQNLFLRCYVEHGRHDFSVGHCAAGPNAFVQCEAHEPMADSGPIESWGCGVLFDNVVVDGNAITLGYRAGNNAGIGWSAANCVLWNCSASVIRCWNPPGAQNWSLGSWGSFEGDGIWQSSNDFMKPDNLFAGQLKDRIGPKAAENLRLMPKPREGSSNPTIDQAQVLASASHTPAMQLSNYIAKVAEREPIPSDPGNVRRINQISIKSPEIVVQRKMLEIKNGWLTAEGKLLVGGVAEVAWWRGTVRPAEASEYGIAVTRFVPGRIGTGLTDDLNVVCDMMQNEGKIALNHNYGLWYDRRRDDHERTRRIDGGVLPPFYEQPFARSGHGTAWDGLSRYDLTKFNLWYWSRLRDFSDLCEQRGLILFHQNYFQHNILEAGAHWADFPWRSANNINNTGFPEPPPYAGDKRIFQAELFYDIFHPVRRKLHENYINQCLNNFTNRGNVIQFASAEYTGPRQFMEFWLDTVAQWKQEKNVESTDLAPLTRAPLIALSATKDVQDAILADLKRNNVVDIIHFGYWWRTDKGEFAPPGGKNLSPRQFERQWRGGRPNDINLADMALEYRSKYPDKPLICDFDTAGWAWVCAGGSLPRLPRTTDPELLAAIPMMQPCNPVVGQKNWILREPGRQMLVYVGDTSPIDLSGETGSYRFSMVDSRSGKLIPGGTLITGSKVELPKGSIVWLVK